MTVSHLVHSLGTKILVVLILACLLLIGALPFLIKGMYELALNVASVGLIAALSTIQIASHVPFRISRRNDLIALSMITDKTSALASLLGLMTIGVPAALALTLSVAIGLAFGAGVSAMLGRRVYRTWPNRVATYRIPPVREWNRAWAGTMGYGSSGVLGQLQSLDVAAMAAIAGPAAAGIYGSVSRWTTPLMLPSTSIAQSGIVHVAGAESMAKGFTLVKRTSWMLIPGVIGAALLAIFGTPIVESVLGPAYSGAGTPLAILAIAAIPASISQPLAMILQARNHDREVSFVMGASIVPRFLFCTVGAVVWGPLGGAYGVLVQQLLVTGCLIVITWIRLRSEGGEVGMGLPR